MKRGSTIFLRLVVYILGAGVLSLCIFALPPAIAADSLEFYRPLLLGLYLPTVPFFIALHQSLKLLGNIDQNTAFSDVSVRALGTIKRCAIVISALFAAGLPYVLYVADRDDAPGAVLIGLAFVAAPVVIGVFAAILQQLLQNAIEIKSENDLTV